MISISTFTTTWQEGKSGLDYANLYLAYISKMSSLVEIDGCLEDRKVQVHVSFLCLAGSLLGLSKYMVMFREKIDEAQEMKPFKQIVDEEFEVRKAKTKMTQIFKMQLVAQVGTHLAKFASSITSYLNMINKMNDTDKEQDYFNKIMGKMSTYVVQFALRVQRWTWVHVELVAQLLQSNAGRPWLSRHLSERALGQECHLMPSGQRFYPVPFVCRYQIFGHLWGYQVDFGGSEGFAQRFDSHAGSDDYAHGPWWWFEPIWFLLAARTAKKWR